jgi:BMFP domain-containing protein YqiC
MQTTNPFFDDLAKLATGAAGAFQGAKQEMETAFRSQVEKFIVDFDLVQRAEFDAVKALCTAQAERIDALEARLAALEARPDAPAGTASTAP